MRELTRFAFRAMALLGLTVIALSASVTIAATVEVFHADSLSGPMRGLKNCVRGNASGRHDPLTPGVSRELADRILKGDVCDVFTPSSPAVIKDLMKRKVAGSDRDAATWYVVFSATAINGDLLHAVIPPADMTFTLLQDVGW